jgi:AraC-like DNA-binding protein
MKRGYTEQYVLRAQSDNPRIQPRFHTARRINYTRPFHWRSHQHRNFEIIYCIRGQYKGRINNQEISLKVHQGVVVQPGDKHEDFCKPPLEYLAITFVLDPVPPYNVPLAFFKADAPAVCQCFDFTKPPEYFLSQLFGDETSPAVHSAALQDAILQRFLTGVLRTLPMDWLDDNIRMPFLDQDFIARFYEMIRRSLSSPLTIKDMARHMQMSPSSLSHKCKTILGESPVAILTDERMALAIDLLKSRHLRVKEAAAAVGYDDPYTFSRAFKRLIGKPPSEFMQSEKNN